MECVRPLMKRREKTAVSHRQLEYPPRNTYRLEMLHRRHRLLYSSEQSRGTVPISAKRPRIEVI